MKKIFVLSGIAFLFIFSITSCKKEVVAINTSLNSVGSLVAPVNQAQITLKPATGGSLVFQWTAAQTPDSGVIQYEVVFDKSDGNFSQPVYKALADGSGTQTQATISQKDMNKIAAMAGIGSSSSGNVKWAVLAYKLTNKVISSETRVLQITRPAGFAVVPDSLFLTGTATEAGDDITKAIPLKKIEDGVFELYTSLKAGTYLLTDHRSTSGTTYYIDANNMIQQGNKAATISGSAQAYRLSYDFNVATSQALAIQSIGLYVSAYNKETAQLNYVGNSTWEVPTVPVQFYQFSWGRDDRYKLVLHTSAGIEYWGSQKADNVQPAGQPASYFYLLRATNDQWNNTYKFDPSADMHNVKVDVFFKPDGPYTHTVTVL